MHQFSACTVEMAPVVVHANIYRALVLSMCRVGVISGRVPGRLVFGWMAKCFVAIRLYVRSPGHEV
jgi:hypothetical protein